MTIVSLISQGQEAVTPPTSAPRPAPLAARERGRLWLLGAAIAAGSLCVVVWWLSSADTREIQALPDGQRIPLYQRTMANLKNICDPAAPRSLRDFCHKEAELVLRFRECQADAQCPDLARRHLPRPYR